MKIGQSFNNYITPEPSECKFSDISWIVCHIVMVVHIKDKCKLSIPFVAEEDTIGNWDGSTASTIIYTMFFVVYFTLNHSRIKILTQKLHKKYTNCRTHKCITTL